MIPLLDDLLALGQDHLDVARVAHVRVDAAVRAVRAAPLLRRLVHLDVLDDQVGRVEALGVRVGFGVLEQVDQVAAGLLGPARFADAEFFACVCVLVVLCCRWVVASPQHSG